MAVQEVAHSERKNEPVTTVRSWYDSFVWCNALSEYLGIEQSIQ